ncbi:MAG: hypothetical protein HYS22_04430 [Deltaproteobacteria bacterium]|nr:hypothetical protein [Deltaproteobacteria bacterium]
MEEKCANGVCEVAEKERGRTPASPVKERYDSSPICYCFHIFRQDIEQEIKKTGKTTIPDFLMAQIKAGNCRCEAVNPQGTCCLGNISAAVKKIMKS